MTASIKLTLAKLLGAALGRLRPRVDAGSPFQMAHDDRLSLWGSYRRAAFERGDAINRAMAIVDAILLRQPLNPLVLACKGSLLALIGNEASRPLDRRRWADLGVARMDDALARLNDLACGFGLRTETLLVCAATNGQLPKSFGRQGLARRQIAQVITASGLRILNRCGQAWALATAALLAQAQGDNKGSLRLLARARDLDRKTAEQVFHASAC